MTVTSTNVGNAADANFNHSIRQTQIEKWLNKLPVVETDATAVNVYLGGGAKTYENTNAYAGVFNSYVIDENAVKDKTVHSDSFMMPITVKAVTDNLTRKAFKTPGVVQSVERSLESAANSAVLASSLGYISQHSVYSQYPNLKGFKTSLHISLSDLYSAGVQFDTVVLSASVFRKLLSWADESSAAKSTFYTDWFINNPAAEVIVLPFTESDNAYFWFIDSTQCMLYRNPEINGFSVNEDTYMLTNTIEALYETTDTVVFPGNSLFWATL